MDHRSYIWQSIEQVSTIHMGVAATQMERRGLATERGTVNREIIAQPEKKPSIWEQLQQA
ncbi:MobA/MobL family protein [Ethanoligenens sp.]|uniref:MobA/MobL family protein n=1 Tax=Ethanoligenens sp. TaxID=2099655 RepID=UPI0039E81B0F